jgi:hypothetical protein
MSQIVERRIVYLREPFPDPQGNPGKSGRPCVIVQLDQPSPDTTKIYVVQITTQFPVKPDPDYIHLKYGHQSRSKLSEKCTAYCPWGGFTPIENIDSYGGLIDASEFFKIVQRLKDLKETRKGSS